VKLADPRSHSAAIAFRIEVGSFDTALTFGVEAMAPQ
jgi:hypothetical protein